MRSEAGLWLRTRLVVVSVVVEPAKGSVLRMTPEEPCMVDPVLVVPAVWFLAALVWAVKRSTAAVPVAPELVLLVTPVVGPVLARSGPAAGPVAPLLWPRARTVVVASLLDRLASIPKMCQVLRRTPVAAGLRSRSRPPARQVEGQRKAVGMLFPPGPAHPSTNTVAAAVSVAELLQLLVGVSTAVAAVPSQPLAETLQLVAPRSRCPLLSHLASALLVWVVRPTTGQPLAGTARLQRRLAAVPNLLPVAGL